MKRFTAVCILWVGVVASAAGQNPPGFTNLDVAQGISSSSPVYLNEYNGKLYLYASDGGSGREPYYLPAPTTAVLIKNMDGSVKHSISLNYNRPSAWYNGKYYFTAHNGSSGEELYVYDGTNMPTIVTDPDFGPDSSKPDNYVVYNNVLYYTATTAAEGQELWSYNGATAQRLTDINAGAQGSVYGPMVAYNNQLYFAGRTDTSGLELWRYNPVSATAEMVADIDTGAGSSNPVNFTVINSKLYFSADNLQYGRELYEYDGNTAPRRVTDIIQGSFSSLSPVRTNAFCAYNNKIYFGARDTTTESHLWSYNPANGQVMLEHKTNSTGESGPREFVVYNGKLFFVADDGSTGYELYSMDGSNAPVQVADLCPGPGNSLPTELTAIGDELYFGATNCAFSGIDLFTYNYKRVGISKLGFEGRVEVYPNPADKEWHLALALTQPATLSLEVTDMQGRTVYTQPAEPLAAGTHNLAIPAAALAAGNYMCRLADTQQVTVWAGKLVRH